LIRDRNVFAAALLLVTLAPTAHAAKPVPADRPINVILMIADGCGPASATLARGVLGRPLALDSILVGEVETGSASSRVTDSAAAATAMACGVKTNNLMLGRDPTGRTVPTILERARERGMATGLVVKSTITDATPAAFAAHVHNRSSQDSVAVQLIDHGVDVLLGGGREWFLPAGKGGSRKDSLDLLARAKERGWTCVEKPQELAGVTKGPVLGLFALDDMAFALDRDPAKEPSLPEMAAKALALLSPSRKGFFVMIEGSLVDHAGHANDPASHARELLEYDETVRQVLRFAKKNGHTLVVSTADHETGGLGLGRRFGDRSVYELHPEALVPVRSTTARMGERILAGANADSLVRADMGAPLSDSERAVLAPALAAKTDVARALGQIESLRASLDWTSGGHTGVDVNLYAFGPGSERFRGLHDNTELAHLLAERLGVALEPLAKR
jgi:alkaline phosphatase